jgi:xylan 1,4-beta-xylosidase
MKSILAGAAVGAVRPVAGPIAASHTHSKDAAARDETTWARGIEGQRRADLGDGTFLNPIVSGDHPDPTILKDGDDYYMTFSSFVAVPGDHHLAFDGPGELGPGRPDADQTRRLGLGARPAEA